MLFRWRGIVSSAWNNGLNWVDENGVAYAADRYPGSIALTYDDVLLDSALAEGAYSIAGGDYSADEGLQSFLIGSDYNGSIGSAGSPLIVHHSDLATNPRLIAESENSTGIYIGVAAAQNLYDIRILAGTITFSGSGTLDGMICLKGTISILSGLTIDTSFHIGQITSQVDVALTIASGVTFSCQPTVNGGNTTCGAVITLGLQMYSGRWIQNAAAASVDVYGGMFIWNSGDLTALRLFGGQVDCSESLIGRNLDGAIIYEKGTLDLDNGMGNIEILNGITIVDGTVNWFPGQQVQPYP